MDKCMIYRFTQGKLHSLPLEDDWDIDEVEEKAINTKVVESINNTDLGTQLDYMQDMQYKHQIFLSRISIPATIHVIKQRGTARIHLEFFYRKEMLANYELPSVMGLGNIVEMEIDNVGKLYDTIFYKIKEELTNLPKPQSQYMSLNDDLKICRDIFSTLERFRGLLKTDYHMLAEKMVYELNNAWLPEYRPLYGDREFGRDGRIYYTCNNLIQLSFAVIDILLQTSTDGKKAIRYIEMCKMCGGHFTAKNRKTKLCTECRNKNILESRKKSKQQSNLGVRRFDNKVMTTLYERMVYCCDNNKQQDAKKLYNLYKQVKAQHKDGENYEDWLKSCISYIMDKDYNGLYEWLSREEV